MQKLLLLFSLCLFTHWGMTQNFSMDFDGTDDRIVAGVLNLSGTQLTIETWVKADQFQAGFPFISSIGGIEEPVGGSTDAALLRFGDASIPSSEPQFVLQFGAGTQKVSAGAQVPLNTWTHIAATYDGSQMRIYINGALSNSISQSGSFTANGTFMLASSYTGRFMNGHLDDFRIWTVARTAAEISSGMNTELTGNETGLLVYYKFDTDDATCDVLSCSPAENHGDRMGPLGANNLPQFDSDVPAITDVTCGVNLQNCSAPPPPPPPPPGGGGDCDNDVWAPLIVYPSQDIVVDLDACDPGSAVVFFEVTVTDDCDGDFDPGPVVVPGEEFTVTVNPLGGFTGGVIIPSPGGETFAGVFGPGIYQILIEAEDASGNIRQEDFFVVVNQDDSSPTNLSCISEINATLDENCQRFVTAEMVLDGNFGCTDPSDYFVNIVGDDDPTNGPIIDGCGQFIYEVTYVGDGPTNPGDPQSNDPIAGTIEGFTQEFDQANWTVTNGGLASTVDFTASSLTISTGFGFGPGFMVAAAIAIPLNGDLSFDYDFDGGDPGFDFFFFVVDDNGNILDQLNTSAAATGSVNETVTAGTALIIGIDSPFDQLFSSTVEITNFNFDFVIFPGSDDTFPFFNWEDCWGYVNGEDKTAPELECPPSTDQGVLIDEAHILSGELDTDDEQLVLTNYSCFISDPNFFPTAGGNHYYELTPFQVSEEDFFTFYLDHEFASDGFIAIYQGSFNPDNPCENIIAQVDVNFLYFDGTITNPAFFNNPPIGGPFDPVVRITLPLRPYETYYILTSTSGADDTGAYDWVVFSDGDGWLGEWDVTVTVDPQTWEETIEEEFNGFPTEPQMVTLPLFCEDFDLIFNNPASMVFTGNPLVDDNCADNVNVSFVDTYTSAGDCTPIIITRTFSATDDKGNTATCGQTITLNRPSVADIQLPSGTAPIECDEDFDELEDGNPDANITGYPFVVTVSGIFNLEDSYCNLGASFSDGPTIDVCTGAYKLVRTWDILDWCGQVPFLHYDQIVKVGDFTPPSVTCPGQDYDWDGDLDPLVFSTSPFSCTASFSVPLPQLVDNCSDYEVHTEIVTEVEVDVVNQYGQVTGTRIDTVVVRVIPWNAPTRLVSGIPAGGHYFRYRVEDDCGNKVVVYCEFAVRDQIEPTAICDDNLHISIGGQDFSRIYATDIDEGSNDNCDIGRIEVRRNQV